jgi:hypothetical protein
MLLEGNRKLMRSKEKKWMSERWRRIYSKKNHLSAGVV